MKMVNIHEAKTHLSRLVDQAAEGEEVTIARAGKPVAKLIAYRPAAQDRAPGVWRGQVWMSHHFDEPDEATVELFEGGE